MEMKKIDETCDMEEFDTLDNSEKTIAILRDIDGGHRLPDRKGIDTIGKKSTVVCTICK